LLDLGAVNGREGRSVRLPERDLEGRLIEEEVAQASVGADARMANEG
jgi:hypothetical protein